MQERERRDNSDPEDEGSGVSTVDDNVQALDSDNLDDDKVDTAKRGKRAVTKRKKRASLTEPKKRRRKVGSDEIEGDLELKQGQEIVGNIVRAPETGKGKAPELQVSNHPNENA